MNHDSNDQPMYHAFSMSSVLSGSLVKIKASANGALSLLAVANLHGGASPATLQVNSARGSRGIVADESTSITTMSRRRRSRTVYDATTASFFEFLTVLHVARIR